MNTLAGTWLAFLFVIHSLYFNVLHSKGGQLMNEIKWRALCTASRSLRLYALGTDNLCLRATVRNANGAVQANGQPVDRFRSRDALSNEQAAHDSQERQ